MEKTLWLDWIPQVQTLATGTVDEVTWGFEDAPFYVEALDERKAGWYMNCLLTCYMSTLTDFSSCRAITGVYNIRRLGYTTETREVSDANGDTRYRCAVTGMFVNGWRSPYGKACSREEALEYYNKCSAQIDSAVAQVVAARSSDGKPLSDVEKLKWVHDWLIKTIPRPPLLRLQAKSMREETGENHFVNLKKLAAILPVFSCDMDHTKLPF